MGTTNLGPDPMSPQEPIGREPSAILNAEPFDGRRVMEDIRRNALSRARLRKERDVGLVQQAFGTGPIMAGLDYGLALSNRAVGAATDLAGDLVGGAIRLGSFGYFKPDISYENLLNTVSNAATSGSFRRPDGTYVTVEGGAYAKGRYMKDQDAALRGVEGEGGILKEARLLSEEILRFAAPFGVLGKGSGALTGGFAAGIKLPGTLISEVSAPIAKGLGATSMGWMVKLGRKVGMTDDAIRAAAMSGSLLSEVVSKSPLLKKVPAWFAHSAPQIAGTAIGFGEMTFLTSFGNQQAPMSLKDSMWTGLGSAAMAPFLVAGGQIADRVQVAMTKGGLQRAGAEELMSYMKTGKGWSAGAARVAAGAVEGAFVDPRQAADFIRAVVAGDWEAITASARNFLASVIGMAAVRGYQPQEIPIWRRRFPNDIVDPLQKAAPSLADIEQVADMQRHGWKLDAGDAADVSILKIDGFDGTVRLDPTDGLTVKLEGEAWASLSDRLGLKVAEESHLGILDKDGAPIGKRVDVEHREFSGDRAQEVLDSIIDLTSADNMRLRQVEVEDAVEVDAGVLTHPRGVQLTHRFGVTKLRSAPDGEWRVGAQLGEPVRRTDAATVDAIEKGRDFASKLQTLSTRAKTRMAQALDHLEHSRPTDAAANEAIAFVGEIASDPAMRALGDIYPQQFARLFHRVASGTMSFDLAIAEMAKNSVPPEPVIVNPDVDKPGYTGFGKDPKEKQRTLKEILDESWRAAFGGEDAAKGRPAGDDVPLERKGGEGYGDASEKPKAMTQAEALEQSYRAFGDQDAAKGRPADDPDAPAEVAPEVAAEVDPERAAIQAEQEVPLEVDPERAAIQAEKDVPLETDPEAEAIRAYEAEQIAESRKQQPQEPAAPAPKAKGKGKKAAAPTSQVADVPPEVQAALDRRELLKRQQEGRVRTMREKAMAGDTTAAAIDIGLHRDLIKHQSGTASPAEWLGRKPPPMMFRKSGVRTLDALAEKLRGLNLIAPWDTNIPAEADNAHSQAEAFLEALRNGQRFGDRATLTDADMAWMQAEHERMGQLAEDMRAADAEADRAEQDAVRDEAIDKLTGAPDFDITQLENASQDIRIDDDINEMTRDADTGGDVPNPESGRAMHLHVAIADAVRAVFKPVKAGVLNLRKYLSRPVAEQARAELERAWGERDVQSLRDYVAVVEMKEEFEKLLGRNPLTGDRPTTDAGRRVARALNRTSVANALEDLTFYSEKTGNPRYDQPGREDTLADVEARLPPEAKAIAGKMRAMWDDLHTRSVNTPLIQTPSYLESYVRHRWELGNGGGPVTDINSLLRRESRLQNPVFARARTIPTFAEGMRAGYRPTTLNPFDILLNSAHAVNKIHTAAKFIDSLRTMPVAPGSTEMMAMDAASAPDNYVDYGHPMLKGMLVHPELLGGTSRGLKDQTWLDRKFKFAGGLDILDRVTGKADFQWDNHPWLSGLRAVAHTTKKMNIALSGFHHFVLGFENRFLYMFPSTAELWRAAKGDTEGAAHSLKAGFGQPSAILQTIKGNMEKVLENMSSPEAENYTRHGLDLTGIPSDFKASALSAVTKMIRRGGKWVGGEQMASLVESLELVNDRLLWETMLPILKISLADIQVAREEARQGRPLTEAEMKLAMSHVNGVMGNTDWNRVWRIPKKFSDLMSGTTFFAWDWTVGNLITGPGRFAKGLFDLPTKGVRANQNLRYGGYTAITGFVKAAILTQATQALIWKLFATDEERERLSLAGKSPAAPTWENEGSGHWTKYEELLSVRLPMRGKHGEMTYLRPWKQISEQFGWATDFGKTMLNKLSRPVQEAILGVAGIEGVGWPKTANEDVLLLDGLTGKVKLFAEQMLDWVMPFSISNTTTPLGGWGMVAPFPVSAGTTNFKTRQHLSTVLQNYARTGDPAVMEDAKWVVHGAEVNSLPSDTLFKQSISMARSPFYRRYFDALNNGDMEAAGRQLLALTRLGATSKDVEGSIKGRFNAAIGQREQPDINLREAFNRARKSYQSILEDVPEATKPMLRLRRDVLEGWRRNADFVKIPARQQAVGG